MHEEQRVFSLVYIIGSLLAFLSGVTTIIAFSSPYWTESDSSKNKIFSNLGLWEICFFRYKHLEEIGRRTYTGCYWLYSNEALPLEKWLLPRKP